MPGWVQCGARHLAQAHLQERAARVAYGLEALNLAPEAAVALLLRNDFPLFEASAGAAAAGLPCVPINWHSTPEEVLYILGDSGAKVLVAHADLLVPLGPRLPPDVLVFAAETPPEIAKAYRIPDSTCHPPPNARPWDAWVQDQKPRTGPAVAPVSIIYTSGTTGRPKGVKRLVPSAEAARKLVASAMTVFDMRPDARTIVAGPMYHTALNVYGLGMAAAGAAVWLLPRFDAEELLAMIAEHRITHLHLVPIMFVRLLKLSDDARSRYDISSLRHVVHAAAPCPADVKRRMIDWWGPIIHEYYGSTETRAIAGCNTAEWLDHPGTVGRALPDSEIAILDPDGRRLGAGEVGEVYGRNLAAGDFTYINDPAKRAEIERDGLLTSGDIGYLDQDGFLYLCDRRKDIVISGGVNIYPAEIESCLFGCPGVQDCAVFGIPDEEYGEAIAAAIQLKTGETTDAEIVRAFVRSRLAGYKVPKVITFTDDLPREDSGKIFKRKLREPYWAKVGRSI